MRICEPWIQQLGTAEADRGTGIAVDKFGNLYITGYTKGAFEGQNSGMEDIFIVKYDVHGNRLWGDQFGTGETDESRGVAVDKDGNAYISGYTLGALDGNDSKGGKDFFITKYNSKGKNRLWTKQGGATWSDASSGVVVDSSGAAYITGFRTEERVDKNFIFVAKYVEIEKEKAKEVWSKSVLESEVNGSGHDVALDGQGNIYISGSAVGTGGEPRLRDIVIAKYDSVGNKLWNNHMGTPKGDEAHGIAVDSQGNAYITGFRGATLDELDEDEKVGLDIFVSKYATDGKHIWSEVLVTNENDYGTAVALDVEGNVYITGYTDGVLDDNGAKGGRDIFVAKYNADGSERWVQQIGTTSTEEGSDIVIGGDGNIYITGYTDGALGKAHWGSDDIFIAKVCEDKS